MITGYFFSASVEGIFLFKLGWLSFDPVTRFARASSFF